MAETKQASWFEVAGGAPAIDEGSWQPEFPPAAAEPIDQIPPAE